MAGFTDLDEDIPYRSIPTAPAPEDAVDIDEEELSSLRQAKKALDEGWEELKFDLTEANDEDEDDLRVEIRARKRARAIIEPAKLIVDNAVEAVENKRKGKA